MASAPLMLALALAGDGLQSPGRIWAYLMEYVSVGVAAGVGWVSIGVVNKDGIGRLGGGGGASPLEPVPNVFRLSSPFMSHAHEAFGLLHAPLQKQTRSAHLSAAPGPIW